MREITNTRSLLSADLPQSEAGDLEVRPISLSSMAMLELLQNGCLGMFRERLPVEDTTIPPEDSGGKGRPSFSMYALAEFVWVHAAPEMEVIRLVAGGGFDDVPAIRRAVLAFAGSVGFGHLEGIIHGMVREMEAIKSAQSDIQQDPENPPSKN